MSKKFVCVITALALILSALPVFAAEGDGKTVEYTWDLTALNADDYNAEAYTALGGEGIISIKADAQYITDSGIKADKNNKVRIKFESPSDGQLTVTYTGGAVVIPTKENRSSSDEAIVSGTAAVVADGTSYWIQGANGSASTITSVSFTNKQDTPSEPENPSPTDNPSPTGTPSETAEINVHSGGVWDLTKLEEYKDKFADYTAVDDIGMIAVKSAEGNISSKGLTVKKVSGGNSGAFIKITPTEDGLLTASFTGSGAVVMSPKESRSSSDPNIYPDTPFMVKKGTTYWMQGSSGTAVVRSISFEAADTSAINVYNTDTGVWDLTGLDERAYMFGSDYTSVDIIDVLSVKAASASVTSGGIEADSSNQTCIKITPNTNGELSVTFLGGSLIISKQEERKDSAETALTSDTPYIVRKNVTYYIQGSVNEAAVISAIKFEDKEIVEEPINTYNSESSTWTLTDLSKYADRFDTQNYTAIDEIKAVSVKSDSSNIEDDGIKVSKSGGAVIRIIPAGNGKLTVNFTGSGVIFTDYEKRSGSETSLSTGDTFDVLGGVPYYVQGASGTAASVTSISFEGTISRLFEITGIGFNEEYTKVVEFDIEKGDDYDHDVTAVICVYDGNNALKKVGIRKISKKALVTGSNTIKCDIDITGYNSETDQVKIFLWSKLS